MDFFYPKFNKTTHIVLADSINSDEYPYNASYTNKKTFKLKEGAEVCAVRENIGYKCEWSEVIVIDTQLTDAEYYNKRVYVKTAFLNHASNKKTFLPVCSEENSVDVFAQEIDPNLKEIFIPYIDKRNGFYSVRIQTDYEKILDSFLFENLVNDVLFEGVSILLQSRGLRSDNATIQDIIDSYCTFAYVQNDFDLTINRKCEPITFTVSIPLSFFNQLPETQEIDDTFDLVVNTIKFDNKTAFRTINDIIRMFSYRASDIIGITFPNYLIENFTIDIEQANLRLFASSLSELLQTTAPEYALAQNKYIEYSFGLDKNYNLVRIEITLEGGDTVILKKDQVSRFRMTGAFHNKRIFNYLLKSDNFLPALKDIKNKILPILQEYVDFPKISLVKESIVLNGQTLPPDKVREFRVAFSNKKEGCLSLSGVRGAFVEGIDIYSDPLYHAFINGGHEESGKDQKQQSKGLLDTLRDFREDSFTSEGFAVNLKTTAGSTVGGFTDALADQFPFSTQKGSLQTNLNTISYILHRINLNKVFLSKLICLLTGLNPSDPQVSEILRELPDQVIQHINYLNSIKGLEGAEYAKAVANGLNINSGLFCIQNQDIIYLVKGLTALLKVANYTGATLVKFQKIKNNIERLKDPKQKINPYAQLGRAVGTALSQVAIMAIFDSIKYYLDNTCEDPLADRGSGNRYENLFNTTAPTVGYGNTSSNSDKNTLNRNRGNALDEAFGTQAQLQYGFDRTYTIDLLDLLFNDINCILTPAETISLLKGIPSELVKTLVKNIIRNKYYSAPNDLSFMLADENKLFGFFKRLGATVDEAGIADKLEPIANPINPSNICSDEQLEARKELIKGKLPKNFDILDRQLRTRTLKAKTLLEKIKDGSQDIDFNPLCDIDDAAKNNFVDHMTTNYYNLLEDTFKSPLATFNDEANILPTVYENKKSLIRKKNTGEPIGAVQYKNYNEGLYYNLSSRNTLQVKEALVYKELCLPLEHERTAGELSLAILPTNESENKIDILCNPDLVPLDKQFEQLFLSEGNDQGEALIWMEVFSVGEPADYTFDNTVNWTDTKSDLNEMYDIENSDAYNSKLAKSLRKKPYFIAIEIDRELVSKHKYDLKFILNDTYNKQFRVLAHLAGESELFGEQGKYFTDNEKAYDPSDYPEIYGITKEKFDHINNESTAIIYSFYKKYITKALESTNTLNALLENLNKFNEVGLFNIKTEYDTKSSKLIKNINVGVLKNNGQIDEEHYFSIDEIITDHRPYKDFNALNIEINETELSDKSAALQILRSSILNSINRGEFDVSYIKNIWSEKEFTYIENSKGSSPGMVVDSPFYHDEPSIKSEYLDAYPKADQNNPYYALFSKLSLFNRPKNIDYSKCNVREHYLNFDFFRDRYLKGFEVQLCESIADTPNIIRKLAAELLIRELVSETLLKALPYFGSMTKEQFSNMYKDKIYRNIVNNFVIKEAEKKFSPVSYFTDILVDIYQNDNNIIKKSSELVELTSGDPFDYYIAREMRYFSQYCIKYSIIKFAQDTVSNFMRQTNYDLEFTIDKYRYGLNVENDINFNTISYSTLLIKEQDLMNSGQDQVTSVRTNEYFIPNASSVYKYLDNAYKYELIYFILHGKLKHEIDSAFIGTKNTLASLILQNIQGTEQENASAEQAPDYQDINNFITNLAFSPNPSAMISLKPEYSRYVKYFLTAALNLARSQTLTIAKTTDPNIMLTRAIDESLATVGMLSWSLIPQETRNNLIKGDSSGGLVSDTTSLFYKRLEDGRSLSPDALTSIALVWIPLTPVGWGYLFFDTLQEIQYTQKALTEIRALRGLKDGQDPCEITSSPFTAIDANPPTCTPDKREKALTDINSIEPEYESS